MPKEKVKKEKTSIEHPESFSKLELASENVMLSWYDFFANSLRREIKKKPKEFLLIFVFAFLGTVLASAVLFVFLVGGINMRFSLPSFSLPTFSVAEISTGSNSSSVKYDPVILLDKIKKGEHDYALIDIRSFDEYEEGHIKTALSMPVYGTNLIKEDGSLDRGLIKKAIEEKSKDKKTIIIYGHSQHSSVSEKVASILGKKSQVLSVGWNEWAHFKTLWVPEGMWNEVDLSSFIQTREE